MFLILLFWSMEKRLKWFEKQSGDVFPTKPDLANMLGRTDFDFDIFPKQRLRVGVLTCYQKKWKALLGSERGGRWG